MENPKSGKDLRNPVSEELKAALSDVQIVHVKTEYAGHASSLAAEFIRSSDALFVAGGDGTLNDAIQSIPAAKGIPILVIPTGTGSDFARSLGIFSLKDSISAFRKGKIITVDTALMRSGNEQRLFVNVAEIGFGASVMERVNNSASGRNVFIRSILRELSGLKSYSIEITCDDVTRDFSTSEIVIANAHYFGRGMHASPGSLMDDGLLDVHLIRKIGRIALLMNLGSLKSGKYVKKRMVENFSCRRISVTGDRAPVEIDGEVVGFTPVTIQVIPKSLSFYTNI
ncbi:MAG: diacylglycerol/lipid kinase family protein [Thermoplasmata archaeon]